MKENALYQKMNIVFLSKDMEYGYAQKLKHKKLQKTGFVTSVMGNSINLPKSIK